MFGRAQKKKDFSTMVRDPDGEERVLRLGKELRAKKVKYVDNEFKTDGSMLFVDPNSPPPFMQAIADAYKKNLIKWLRPDELGQKTEKFQVFADGIEPEDIHQGAIGDCYFLAALAICATREELISDLIVEDCAEEGIYGVKFYYQGTWKTIIVDDLIPSWQVGDEWLPIFCRWKGEKETWAMLAEKAWAKLHGSYEAIDGGKTEDALGYLSGGCTTTTIFRDRNGNLIPEVENSVLWKKLLTAKQSNGKDMGCFMSASGVKESTAGKKGDANPNSVDEGTTGLVSGHAYSVLDVQEIQGHHLIQLRNPWGNYEWGGDWSDNSPLWTESLKKAVNFVAADDGSFWMSFKDFTNEYSQVGICKTVPSTWSSAFCEGQWVPGATSGGSSEVSGHFNPTYEITNEDSHVWLQLEQPDLRGHLGDWIVADLRIVRKPKDGQVVNIAETIIPFVSVAERQRAIEVELDPSQGPYLIIPTCWAPGVAGTFYLSAYSSGNITLKSIPTPKPNGEEAAKMTKIVLPKNCGTCSKPVPHFVKKSMKGVRFHETPECYKCTTCRSNDVYDVGLYEGQWKPFCFDCWNPKFGDSCVHCKKPIQTSKAGGDLCCSIFLKGKLHFNCKEDWREFENLRLADKCFFCSEPILKIEGKFSGKYFEIDGKGGIHEECHATWKEKNAKRCLHCREFIASTPGKFSGRYYSLEKGQVHEECGEAYNNSQALACIHCSLPIIPVEGKFSGSFLPVGDSGVHAECIEAYNLSQADSCIFCKNPVCKIEGKYSGTYYPIEGQGKLHEECAEEWRKA